MDLQLLSGARPGELIGLRAVDIDSRHDPWRAELRAHKSAHISKSRTVYFGPRAQRVLAPFMASRPVDAPLFSPREAEQERYAACATHRRAAVEHAATEADVAHFDARADTPLPPRDPAYGPPSGRGSRRAKRVVTETSRNADLDIYSRGTRLVRVVRSGIWARSVHSGLVITDLPISSLRERMSRRIEFVKIGPEGQVMIVHPPDRCVKQADARAQWPEFRELVAISDVPVLRPDGSVHQTAGFDPVTGVLYAPGCEFPRIPDSPTDEVLIDATAQLVDPICDVRFVEPAHQSAYLAALLTVVGRFAFGGPAPLFVFDANVRGAGKSLLAFVAATIAIGPGVGTSGYVESDKEMRKQITAKLIEDHRLVILNNLPGRVGCPSLDRLLTTTTWTDRILGKSASATLPATAVWFATGNNVVLMADTARRVVPIRIEVLDDNPEDRVGFRYPDLLRFIRENRVKLLCACLTWLSAYIRAGKPSQALVPFGSFEGWSDTIRSAVVYAGFEDPCAGRAQLEEDSDRARDELLGVLDGLRKFDPLKRGLVVADMLASLYSAATEAPDDVTVRRRAALEAAVGSHPGRAPTARQVGNYLRANRRRVVAGMHLDNDSAEKRSRWTVWHVRQHDAPSV